MTDAPPADHGDERRRRGALRTRSRRAQFKGACSCSGCDPDSDAPRAISAQRLASPYYLPSRSRSAAACASACWPRISPEPGGWTGPAPPAAAGAAQRSAQSIPSEARRPRGGLRLQRYGRGVPRRRGAAGPSELGARRRSARACASRRPMHQELPGSRASRSSTLMLTVTGRSAGRLHAASGRRGDQGGQVRGLDLDGKKGLGT